MTILSGGNVGIGTTNPASSLDISSKTDAIILPKGTTAQQPGSPVAGMIRFNSSLNALEVYNSSSWITVSSASTSVNPVGLIAPFPTSSCPSGWLEANGAAVSRTLYSGLFSSIASTYGSGDGSTTFNLPDYRGYFLRGWDHGATNDPDSASRTTRGDGTTGDNVGTKQGNQIQSHNHSETSFGNVSPNQFWINSGSAYGGAYTATTGNSGGNETRPKNINVLYCISTATVTATTLASSGSGTTNYIPQWTSTTALGNSPIAVSGSNVGIGTTTPSAKLEVSGGVTKLQQEPWNYPTLGASWLNYGASYSNLGYRLDSMGYLRMRGLIKSGVTGSTIFTLPVGYRPLYSVEFIVACSGGTANIIITSSGNVYIETMSSNGWVSFDNISIPLD